MLEVTKTEFKDLLILAPKVFHDGRGYFFEAFNEKRFKDSGISQNFIQDNQSYSEKGTLRGLHFQTGVHAQAKLVRVLQGEILDVVVDLRKNEPTFGKHYSVVLSDKNFKQFLVPRGFAHGFVVLSDTALVHYKCDNYYAAASEAGIHFADPDLKIDWKTDHSKVLLSDKDKKNLSFKEITSDDKYISHWS